MALTVKVDDRGVRAGLGELRGEVTNVRPLLAIAGNLMLGSIARTFRDEGSPAGSWPRLALSTLKKKGYTSGHKLLIMSGRLFGSFTMWIEGNTMTVGTNVPYAAAQNFGTGALSVRVAEHGGLRVKKFRQYGKDVRQRKDGRAMTVHVRAQGPDDAARFRVKEHSRRMNIPPRMFAVFRPEDPQRIADGFEAYLAGKSVSIGNVTFNRAASGGVA